MTHPRKTIRDAVEAIIVNAGIVPIGNVHLGRFGGFAPQDLPAICIYSGDEEASAPIEQPTGTQQRDYQLTVEVIFENSDETALEDEADAFAERVESAMAADRNLGTSLVMDSYLTSTSRETTTEAETPTASILLTYTIRYYA